MVVEREPTSEPRPAVVLGAGYAGLRVARTIAQSGRGRIPVVLVDRHPLHVLRTELYSVGRIASVPSPSEKFAVPFEKLLLPPSVTHREGEVTGIDLDRQEVRLGTAAVPYRALVIALGSVAAYYGVPGAADHTHSVYRLGAAERLATALRSLESSSASWSVGRRPEILVVGGGSTGTEVAAEIATVDWTKIAGPGVRAPHVRLLTGALPLLGGLPPGLIRHARALLKRARVELDEGHNVAHVDASSLTLDDGSSRAFDLCVWAAGVQAPQILRSLPVPHGHSGRLLSEPTLELPGRPGVFAVGDVVECIDPETGVAAPATAQAAVAEARVAGRNLVASWSGRPLVPFHYREKGVIVSLGLDAAAAAVRHVTLWGRPAKFLKTAVEREYAFEATRPRPLRRGVKNEAG